MAWLFAAEEVRKRLILFRNDDTGESVVALTARPGLKDLPPHDTHRFFGPVAQLSAHRAGRPPYAAVVNKVELQR